ncbi:2-oxoacid:ferredoxin oxidoreductase subunit beta [bacterium]|nr:2-oxoacid:ferredoxin oxidoreductase subunit beta [bacterium]
MSAVENKPLTKKDFESDQDVRWCPGCGDYAILSQVQKMMPVLGNTRENTVFVSGIGCSSRFPYYLNTYGFHTIHGRAPAFAIGIKAANPNLDVWIATGDGDALSIGGNHFIHLMRRNPNIKVLLFNNRIYGLTKGQYSPTSEHGKVTKSSPFGSIEEPFNPTSLALGANASFVARAVDRDTKHLSSVIEAAAKHKGTAFVEIYQNCIIFNDGAFTPYTEKETKLENCLYLEHGKPMVFGQNSDKGIKLDGTVPKVVSLTDGKNSLEDLIVHDQFSEDQTLANLITHLSDNKDFPVPVGVFRSISRPCYEDQLVEQMESAKALKGTGDLQKLFNQGDTWEVK